MSQALKVAFLTGSDSESTRDSIAAVAALPGIEPVAILFDDAKAPVGRRIKNLRRNIRRNGWRYIPNRLLGVLRQLTDRLAERVLMRSSEVDDLLKAAFPDRSRNLWELSDRLSIPLEECGNLNEERAVGILRARGADLGVVLGTRVLRPVIFSVPRLGCVNLHKGKVPEFRGMPPAFWEVFEGAAKTAATVHFVDSKLDTGPVVDAGEVDVLPGDTPDTLMVRLNEAGLTVLTRAVSAIAAGTHQTRVQPQGSHKAKTTPTLADVAALRARLPHWIHSSDASSALKNVVYLLLYVSGIYGLVRLVRRLRGQSRAAIILYHRVNDLSRDTLTVDIRMFAAHLLAIGKFNATPGTTRVVRDLRDGRGIPGGGTAVLIHFDDAYLDVHTNAGPLLKLTGIPATHFVNSGFVGTSRRFDHDARIHACRQANCDVEDLRRWVANGCEVGAHTVNHADLGQCTPEEARREVVGSGQELALMTGGPIPLFSFPFGRLDNIREDVRQVVREAGYEALFSAHGGYVDQSTSVWDIPRFGANSNHRPLWLLMEVEGLSLAALGGWFRRGG